MPTLRQKIIILLLLVLVAVPFSADAVAAAYPDTYSAKPVSYGALMWAVDNSGQAVNNTIGRANADMDLDKAWSITEGSKNVIVAVVDTGVDYTHPDLAGSMWDGSACVDDTGVPIPGGCKHGYDYENDDPDPMPDTFHGTHVAGTIAATNTTTIGIIGVAPHTKIMALRVGQDVISEVRAINFARENGAKILNASFTRNRFVFAEYEALKAFQDAGGIVVAAAANSHNNDDVMPQYPANYDLPGIISVAATDQSDQLASFSNYGPVSVDIGAPGVNIASLVPGGKYGFSSGTSMAAPQVSGVAALVWAVSPDLTGEEVKALILNTGDPLPSLQTTTVSGKRVNAYAAVLSALSHVPDTTLSNTTSTLDK